MRKRYLALSSLLFLSASMLSCHNLITVSICLTYPALKIPGTSSFPSGTDLTKQDFPYNYNSKTLQDQLDERHVSAPESFVITSYTIERTDGNLDTINKVNVSIKGLKDQVPIPEAILASYTKPANSDSVNVIKADGVNLELSPYIKASSATINLHFEGTLPVNEWTADITTCVDVKSTATLL